MTMMTMSERCRGLRRSFLEEYQAVSAGALGGRYSPIPWGVVEYTARVLNGVTFGLRSALERARLNALERTGNVAVLWAAALIAESSEEPFDEAVEFAVEQVSLSKRALFGGTLNDVLARMTAAMETVDLDGGACSRSTPTALLEFAVSCYSYVARSRSGYREVG